MATTTRLNNASVLNQPHKAYVTTGPFASAIYSYSVSTNFTNGQFVTTGTLTALGAGVVGVYNVAGTVLRENGKKLIPGVNPDITQYYVGVYHPEFGSGYINPNGPLFALYNSDTSNYLYNGADLLENELGPPVVTAGSVTAASLNLTSTGTAASVGSVAVTSATPVPVSSSLVTTSSFIFLSVSDASPGAFAYVSAQAVGTFTITVSADCTVRWLIIN